MLYYEAACYQHKGQDSETQNYLFAGRCMEQQHAAMHHPTLSTGPLNDRPVLFSIFHGAEEGNAGAFSAFRAARTLQSASERLKSFVIPEREFLRGILWQLDEPRYPLSGIATVLFSDDFAYITSVGDVCICRLRGCELRSFAPEPAPSPAPRIYRCSCRRDDIFLLGDQTFLHAVTSLELSVLLSEGSSAADGIRILSDFARERVPEQGFTVILCRIR